MDRSNLSNKVFENLDTLDNLFDEIQSLVGGTPGAQKKSKALSKPSKPQFSRPMQVPRKRKIKPKPKIIKAKPDFSKPISPIQMLKKPPKVVQPVKRKIPT